MNLTENKKRLACQIEGTDQIGTLYELAIMNRYTTKSKTKESSESVLRKLRALPWMYGGSEWRLEELPSAGETSNLWRNAGINKVEIQRGKAGRAWHYGAKSFYS